MQLLFADQLGPHFDLGGEILLPEVLSQFSKRNYHRQKAHLILYAIRARARDPRVRSIAVNSYRDLIGSTELTDVIEPTSRPMRALVEKLGIPALPARGFCSSEQDWKSYRASGTKPKLENFYRLQRQRLGLLMKDGKPIGEQWNFDEDNRLPPPKGGLGLRHFEVVEDELDQEVRAELNRLESAGVAQFIGVDGPRKFAATRGQALAALEHFVEHQLALFGPYEDAVFDGEWVLAHSMLSAPMNLGLLDPLEVVRRVERAYQEGSAPLASAEGFIRQVIGWRDYVWHLYWEFGEEYLSSNYLDASTELPEFLSKLESESVQANCVSKTVKNTAENAWTHHIQRLMVLGNLALQRGYSPKEFNEWLIDAFVDGTPWVMPANAIGMALYADGGRMSTKPYAAGGSYINKMTNYCSGCRFDPKIRVGEKACPMTAGYWSFMARNQEKLGSNPRMWQAYAGLKRLTDLPQLIAQEAKRDLL